jgi:hypothetical protein
VENRGAGFSKLVKFPLDGITQMSYGRGSVRSASLPGTPTVSGDAGEIA